MAVAGLVLLMNCSGTALLNFTIPRDGYKAFHNIAFGTNPRQQLDIYVPDRLAASQPVIVFFYGGSWQSGDKKDYLFVAQALASKGYIVVIPDYRLYPEVTFPAFMQDAASAFAWVHQHIHNYGGNPDNLFVSGHSAGGYIAAMLTLNRDYLAQAGGDTDWIKGTIGIAGAYDFLPFTDPKIKAIFSHEKDSLTQPIHYVRPDLPPFLLATGNNDKEVYPKNTLHLAEKLRSEGVKLTEKIYPDTSHVGIILSLARGFRGKTPLLEDIAAFVNDNSASPAGAIQ